jgi:hypothetical protein
MMMKEKTPEFEDKRARREFWAEHDPSELTSDARSQEE